MSRKPASRTESTDTRPAPATARGAGRAPTSSSSARAAESNDAPSAGWLRRAHFVARLSRAWDTRFELMTKSGNIGRWYSAAGNECTTIGAAMCMRPGDALSTVHRDLGAILTTYLDVPRLAPDLFSQGERTEWDTRRGDPEEYLYRLMCQVLGRRDGFTQGVDRSFHYGLIRPSEGIRHVGMISHLGSMLPVGAGMALASLQDGTGAVTLGFIGEGATSQGDFHETLNFAGVLKLPYVLVVENNQYAFSTPLREQYACDSLADRAKGYGIAGESIDGTDLFAVHGAMSRAFGRARAGEGATLIEAMLPRMRGHAEGDGSYQVIPEDLRAKFLGQDPLPRLESVLTERGVIDAARIKAVTERVKEIVDRALERGQACPDPDLDEARRPVFAPGQAADAHAREEGVAS